MREVLETIEYKGYSIKIQHDEDAQSPREWCNFGKMVCFHSRYNLGDKHNFSDPEEFLDFIKEHKGKIIVLPLFLYDHSGITMSTGLFSCHWDSGQVGWIYATYEEIRKEHKIKRVTKAIKEKVIKYLTATVETYDKFIRGNVYGYQVEDSEGEEIEDGSCWGFFGYDHKESGLLDHAKEDIECEISRRIKEHSKQLKIWAKNHVPLEYRKPLKIA